MQEGIGRGGYRALAAVATTLGALGLLIAAVSLDPAGFFEWLGLGLAFACLAALLGLVVAALGLPPAAPRPGSSAGAPSGGVVELATPEPPANPDPSADVGFEYGDASGEPPTLAQAPLSDQAPAGPPPRIQPPPTPIVQPRRVLDSKGWPDVQPAGVTRRQLHERNLPRDPGPDIEVEGPAAPTRLPPVVMARTVASAEASGIPEGASVGKCSNCQVLLLAPKKRPLRLQCPRCERVHTLG